MPETYDCWRCLSELILVVLPLLDALQVYYFIFPGSRNSLPGTLERAAGVIIGKNLLEFQMWQLYDLYINGR